MLLEIKSIFWLLFFFKMSNLTQYYSYTVLALFIYIHGQQAIKKINAMDAYDLAVAEAPVNAEDQEGQAHVSAAVAVPIAIGEELRTRYEFRPRFINRCMSIIQPDVAHCGITEFMNISHMAAAFHCQVMPHATIGLGRKQRRA